MSFFLARAGIPEAATAISKIILRSIFASAVLAATAIAEESSVPATRPADGAGGADTQPALQEIVVTAEKREVSIQAAPLSVTAISGAALEASHITSPQDLDFYVP